MVPESKTARGLAGQRHGPVGPPPVDERSFGRALGAACNGDEPLPVSDLRGKPWSEFGFCRGGAVYWTRAHSHLSTGGGPCGSAFMPASTPSPDCTPSARCHAGRQRVPSPLEPTLANRGRTGYRFARFRRRKQKPCEDAPHARSRGDPRTRGRHHRQGAGAPRCSCWRSSRPRTGSPRLAKQLRFNRCHHHHHLLLRLPLLTPRRAKAARRRPRTWRENRQSRVDLPHRSLQLRRKAVHHRRLPPRRQRRREHRPSPRYPGGRRPSPRLIPT